MLLFNQGTTKAQLSIDKDAYQPNSEKIEIKAHIDNLVCESSLKGIKAHLYRHIKCTSTNGSQYEDKVSLMKQKADGVPSHKAGDRVITMGLDQIHIGDKYLTQFKNHKPHIESEIKKWLYSLQPSVNT